MAADLHVNTPRLLVCTLRAPTTPRHANVPTPSRGMQTGRPGQQARQREHRKASFGRALLRLTGTLLFGRMCQVKAAQACMLAVYPSVLQRPPGCLRLGPGKTSAAPARPGAARSGPDRLGAARRGALCGWTLSLKRCARGATYGPHVRVLT